MVSDAGDEDDLNVAVTLGDGVQKAFKVGPHSINFFDPDSPCSRSTTAPRSWGAIVRHTYTEPGYYYGTYTVSDWGGGTDFDTFVVRVIGQQKIAFPAVDDHEYGDQVAMTATGTQSGPAGDLHGGSAGVCEATGENGARIDLVGVGQCTVTAHQAEYLPVSSGGRRLALLRGRPGRPDDHRRRPDAGLRRGRPDVHRLRRRAGQR